MDPIRTTPLETHRASPGSTDLPAALGLPPPRVPPPRRESAPITHAAHADRVAQLSFVAGLGLGAVAATVGIVVLVRRQLPDARLARFLRRPRSRQLLLGVGAALLGSVTSAVGARIGGR